MTLLKDLLALATLCVVGMAIGAYACSILFPVQIERMADQMMAQNLLSMMTFAVPAVVFAYIKTRRKNLTYPMDMTESQRMPLADTLQHLGMKGSPSVLMVVCAIVAMICLLPMSEVLAQVNERWTLPESMKALEDLFRSLSETANEETKEMLDFTNGRSLWLVVLTLAIVPALSEEMLFRGALQPLFTSRWGIHLGILATAVIFSAFHLDFFGFLPRMALGVLLGYLYVFTGSLWANVAAHLANNGFIVVYVFLQQHYYGTDVNDSMELMTDGGDSFEPCAIALVFAAASVVCLAVLWSHYYRGKHTQA